MADHSSIDAVAAPSATAGDTYTATVTGGIYLVAVVASGYGSTGVVCSMFMPDGSTLLPLSSFTSNGSTVLYLPPGKVRFAVDGSATAAQIAFAKAQTV